MNPKPYRLDGPPFVRSWNPLYVLPRHRLYEFDDHRGNKGLDNATQFGLCQRFGYLMSAVALSRIALSKFEIDGDQFRFGPLEADLASESILADNVRDVFKSVEVLRIRVSQSESLPEFGRFNGLRSILSFATNLEWLSLSASRHVPANERIHKCVSKPLFLKTWS